MTPTETLVERKTVTPETMEKLRRELEKPAKPPRKFGWERLFPFWTHSESEPS